MWSFRRNKGDPDRRVTTKDSAKAAPVADPYAFVVPSYRRGIQYASIEAVPTYADNISPPHDDGVHKYETITSQHRWWPYGTYPPAGKPPSQWLGYRQDNYIRSLEEEHVVIGNVAPSFGVGIPGQRSFRPRLNPYWNSNPVARPQHPPAGYSFTRLFDRGVLGRRSLSGEHYSRAQSVTDNAAVSLQGMVPPRRRTSTYRLEPIAYGENNYDVSISSSNVGLTPHITPTAATYRRSFRLT